MATRGNRAKIYLDGWATKRVEHVLTRLSASAGRLYHTANFQEVCQNECFVLLVVCMLCIYNYIYIHTYVCVHVHILPNVLGNPDHPFALAAANGKTESTKQILLNIDPRSLNRFSPKGPKEQPHQRPMDPWPHSSAAGLSPSPEAL